MKGTKSTSQFYHIKPNDDGTVDVFLNPILHTLKTPDGFKDYDIIITVVRGVIPWTGIEDDIRARYKAWCESGEVVYI